MRYATWMLGLSAVLGALGHDTAAAQSNGSWDVVLNGHAIHMNATHDWNEDNWGLGLEHEFASQGPWIKIALANAFKDSVGDPSYMGGAGIKRRFRLGSNDLYFDIGGIAFLMTRETVNHNAPFPGVLPAATIGFKRIALNLIYLPESVADRVTNSKRYDPTMEGVFFLQLKLNASLFGLGRPSRGFLAQSAD